MTCEVIDYTATRRAEDKRAHFEAAVKYHVVSVQIDARRAGVAVPEAYRNTPNLILKFSPRFAPDKAGPLSVGLDGIRQEISFPRLGKFVCAIPWSAVYSVCADTHGAEVAVWAFDVPRELRRAFGLRDQVQH